MNKEEIEDILEELHLVRPEILKPKAKKLFEAIMSIADERDELQQENQELKKQYCERTDCSGRLGNSKKVEQLEKELEQLKEIEKEHQRINGELRVEIKEYQKELEKADSITQSCIFNGKKESEISYRKALNKLEKTNKANKELKDRIDKAVEYIEKHRQIYDIDGSVEPKIDEFSILTSPKYLIDLLKGDKE